MDLIVNFEISYQVYFINELAIQDIFIIIKFSIKS